VKLVIVESPFAGDVPRNLKYLRACIRDCLLRGEAPLASHAIYTQRGVLDDGDPNDRDLGMRAGWAWHKVAELSVCYTDLGITSGMKAGLKHAENRGVQIEMRTLGIAWESIANMQENASTRWPEKAS
jgi:hypothetical protein